MYRFFIETFLMGLKNLRLHKLRTLLTALGIIFGVASVIIMVAIGEGSKQSALDQLKQLGARNILVRSVRPPETNDASARATRVLEYGVKRVDLDRVRTMPNLVKIVPLRDTEQRIVRNDVRVNANACGTTHELFDIINLRLERGRLFTELDENAQNPNPVCVLGALAAKQLFPYEDPIGQTVQVGGADQGIVILEVIGTLEPVGLRAEGAAMIERNLDMDIYFPLNLAQRTFGDQVLRRSAGGMERKNIELTEIWMQATTEAWVEPMSAALTGMMTAGHGTSRDFEVKAPIQLLRRAESLNRLFNFIMVGIASFALIVGGIGIMNIMLATVTERTREIGIRRALGARRVHIVLQFLIETTVISLTGGAVGVILGISGALVLPAIVGAFSSQAEQAYPTVVATWSVVSSFFVSGGIGVGFGLYPAVMASRMDPIQALRHD